MKPPCRDWFFVVAVAIVIVTVVPSTAYAED